MPGITFSRSSASAPCSIRDNSTLEVQHADGGAVVVEFRVRPPSVQLTFSRKGVGLPRQVRLVPLPTTEQQTRKLVADAQDRARKIS